MRRALTGTLLACLLTGLTGCRNPLEFRLPPDVPRRPGFLLERAFAELSREMLSSPELRERRILSVKQVEGAALSPADPKALAASIRRVLSEAGHDAATDLEWQRRLETALTDQPPRYLVAGRIERYDLIRPEDPEDPPEDRWDLSLELLDIDDRSLLWRGRKLAIQLHSPLEAFEVEASSEE